MSEDYQIRKSWIQTCLKKWTWQYQIQQWYVIWTHFIGI